MVAKRPNSIKDNGYDTKHLLQHSEALYLLSTCANGFRINRNYFPKQC